VAAGHYLPAERRWAVPRREGKTLVEALSAARAVTPAWVVVGSWNDYASGSFVEPNSLDQESVVERLEATWSGRKHAP